MVEFLDWIVVNKETAGEIFIALILGLVVLIYVIRGG
jgi:hypothetical protein